MALIVHFSKRDLIPGLEVRLLSHQTIGVAWYAFSHFGISSLTILLRMLAKENSTDRGGILAFVSHHTV